MVHNQVYDDWGRLVVHLGKAVARLHQEKAVVRLHRDTTVPCLGRILRAEVHLDNSVVACTLANLYYIPVREGKLLEVDKVDMRGHRHHLDKAGILVADMEGLHQAFPVPVDRADSQGSSFFFRF